MISKSRSAKCSSFNPILWVIAIALIIGVVAFVTETKAGTVDAFGNSTSSVDSPSLTAPSIGWELDGTNVSGAKITWTPKSSGSYTINVVMGDSVGSATMWTSGSKPRSDSVSIWPAVDARFVDRTSLGITEN